MIRWVAFVAGWVALAIFAVATIVIFAIAAWEDSPRFGNLGILGLFVSGMLGVGMPIWANECPPQRPLPRSVRKRLRAEANRIRLEVEIKRLEREAGL